MGSSQLFRSPLYLEKMPTIIDNGQSRPKLLKILNYLDEVASSDIGLISSFE